ncbi:MAG TPA: response regulator [Kofleriaceae bacterium]|nr:response regulator [Kofleriaceae bacterium]
MKPDPGTLAPHQLLVVDDERDAVEMVLRMVRGRYQAYGTTSAAEALAWLERHRFDAVLVDQRLRDGTGTSILARAAAVAPLCRRVAMSGQAEVGDLLAAINVGKVSRFVLKPFSREGLLEMLDLSLREYEAENIELERWLVARAVQGGERRLVTERRGGRRARRGRPAHWPEGSATVRPLDPDDLSPVVDLFDAELDVTLARLRPERVLDEDAALDWSAELELRMVTRLRDTDQAFRSSTTQFMAVFARTTRDGCRRACRRLADGLPGGVDIHIAAWPEGRAVPEDPAELVARLLDS